MSESSPLNHVIIKPDVLARLNPKDIEAVEAAISDLLYGNAFTVIAEPENVIGPFTLKLGDEDGRLDFEVVNAQDVPQARMIISIAPFKRHIRDYLMICESYYQAIREGTPHQIEAIDMARRGIHDEAATLLQTRLSSKVITDFDTSRRLFTVLSLLRFVKTDGPGF